MTAREELISTVLETRNFTAERLTSGDINQVYKVSAFGKTTVFKINSKSDFPEMFECEAKGLQRLKNTHTFHVPEVLEKSVFKSYQFLQIEYIKTGAKSDLFWEDFGAKLADLHQNKNTHFGCVEDNFIGSLPQSNQSHGTWDAFLINERFLPQLKMARDNGNVDAIETKKIEAIYGFCSELWPAEEPALLHGDLWAGNFMVNQSGLPVLIDPAVYYGHREIDLGMMHLFSGFDNRLFEVYHDAYPLEQGWEERIAYNQLYPLLVHLNLFGRGYLSQILSIVAPFS